jgi:hypothetical protein
MKNLKKMDEKDIVFVKKTFTDKEELEFSKFLKNRKKPNKVAKTLQPTNKLARERV